MSEPNLLAPPSPAPRERPSEQCDVIMKGGITSGVVYPWALAEFARRYRLRGLGGASAGAIGAALGAAAEFGRKDGGFDVLLGLPGELRDGKLGELFRPQRSTRPLLAVLLAATGHDKPGQARGTTGRLMAVLRALIVGFPFATLLGVAPGAALLVWGVLSRGLVAGRGGHCARADRLCHRDAAAVVLDAHQDRAEEPVRHLSRHCRRWQGRLHRLALGQDRCSCEAAAERQAPDVRPALGNLQRANRRSTFGWSQPV